MMLFGKAHLIKIQSGLFGEILDYSMSRATAARLLIYGKNGMTEIM
ncbi:MAG TPA: hypothetical protein P5123_01415 [Spirochaetota bacterium]|nr:hypothetical protein [Spirochaetota bacterium]